MAEAKFQLECVDAHALELALKRLQKQSTGNGVSDVQVSLEYFTFRVDRYAMDGNGSYVGYEEFSGLLIPHRYEDGMRYLSLTPFSSRYVIPRALQVVGVKPAEESHKYTITEAVAFLDEWFEDEDWRSEHFEDVDPPGYAVLQLAFDEGLGEGDYTPPDEDFAYQELRHVLDEALNDLPSSAFDFHQHRRAWLIGWPDELPTEILYLDEEVDDD